MGRIQKHLPTHFLAPKLFSGSLVSGNLCQKRPVSSKFFEVYIIMQGLSGAFAADLMRSGWRSLTGQLNIHSLVVPGYVLEEV